MTGTMTFAGVKEAFDRVYEQLREDDRENAPDSNVWFAETMEGLVEEVPFGPIEDKVREMAETGKWDHALGDVDAPAIAYAFEVNGQSLYRISEAVAENTLVEFFGKCMGYDL